MIERGSAEALASAVGPYLDALDDLDRHAAVSYAWRLLADGHGPQAIVESVLVPAQVEVGARWEAGRRSVAWEHAATAITEQVVLAVGAPPEPEDLAPRGPGPIVLACAEDEGHQLPGRMAAELLRWHGCDVVYLGAPLTGEHLIQFLQDGDALAVGVSCTMTGHLPGALRLIQAAHLAEVPVLAGGAAFGADGRRAALLGADAWADSPEAAAACVRAWSVVRPTELRDSPQMDRGVRRLVEGADELASDAMTVVAGRLPDWPLDWSEANIARQDFAQMLGVLAAAMLLDEERIVHDGLAWRRRYWTARGETESSLRTRFDALAEALSATDPIPATLLRSALDSL